MVSNINSVIDSYFSGLKYLVSALKSVGKNEFKVCYSFIPTDFSGVRVSITITSSEVFIINLLKELSCPINCNMVVTEGYKSLVLEFYLVGAGDAYYTLEDVSTKTKLIIADVL